MDAVAPDANDSLEPANKEDGINGEGSVIFAVIGRPADIPSG